MDTNLLDSKFARIGARLKVAERTSGRSRAAGVLSLDVQTDRNSSKSLRCSLLSMDVASM